MSVWPKGPLSNGSRSSSRRLHAHPARDATTSTHGGFSDLDAGLALEALARQQALVRRYATAFLARYLARDRRFRRFLTGEDAAAQGADVELRASLR